LQKLNLAPTAGTKNDSKTSAAKKEMIAKASPGTAPDPAY